MPSEHLVVHITQVTDGFIGACNHENGLQSALELGILVRCVLTNGFVFDETNGKLAQSWQEMVRELYTFPTLQWSEEQWKSHNVDIKKFLKGVKREPNVRRNYQKEYAVRRRNARKS